MSKESLQGVSLDSVSTAAAAAAAGAAAAGEHVRFATKGGPREVRPRQLAAAELARRAGGGR